MNIVKRINMLLIVSIITLISMSNLVAEADFTLSKETEIALSESVNKEEIPIDVKKVVEKIPKNIIENEDSIEKIIKKEKDIEKQKKLIREEKKLIEERNKLTDKEIAKMILNGDYGNGSKRKAQLEREGRDFAAIQNEVLKIHEERIIKEQKVAEEKAPVETNKKQEKVVSKSKTPVQPKTVSASVSQPQAVSKSATSGKTMQMEATAYSTAQPELGRYTANGTDLHVNPRVVAVDPSVIPLGSTVTIEGYGTYLAADTGGAIKGNRIDIHFPTVNECYIFGRRNVTVTVH